MPGKRFLLFVAFAMAIVLCWYSSAMAADREQSRVLKIYEPTPIPGHSVLLPGTYVVKRLDTTNRVVQILNESQTRVYVTLFAHDFETLVAVLAARKSEPR